MACIDVKTQAEFDSAVARGDCVHVQSGYFTAYGSASVTASDSASVTAYGSASVRASDSASVRAYGSASVTASDSASVRAYGSASVTAYGSASVRASDSASVTAYGSASVRAYGSASVRAYGSASVTASALVPVQDFGPRTKIKGGVVIPIRQPETAEDWCAYYGVQVSRGHAVVFKAVEDDWKATHKTAGISYEPGAKPAAPDWQPTAECGAGLHFSPHAFMALSYCDSATKFVACKVKLADVVVLGDKVKAPRCTVLHECDIDGNPVAVEQAA